jgi:hypothetical protein
LVSKGVVTREEAQFKSMNPNLFGLAAVGMGGQARSL